jgi:hypothetical protein
VLGDCPASPDDSAGGCGHRWGAGSPPEPLVPPWPCDEEVEGEPPLLEPPGLPPLADGLPADPDPDGWPELPGEPWLPGDAGLPEDPGLPVEPEDGDEPGG